MRINKDKTEVMVINKGTIDSNIQIGNEKVKNVSEFNYLGSINSSNGTANTNTKEQTCELRYKKNTI
jgi:hypothetical protein